MVTRSPIATLVRLLHLKNALASMLVTLPGMVMLVRSLQCENAPHPMLVTGISSIESGITTSPPEQL